MQCRRIRTRAPIIIRRDRRALAVVQFDHRILKRIGNPGSAQRRPDAPHQNALRLVRERIVVHNESADQHVGAGADKAARRDVSEIGERFGVSAAQVGRVVRSLERELVLAGDGNLGLRSVCLRKPT